ncbi:hypothetical protein DID75_02590 [Candidatus Marinamargulisbacteria bacterium SCGC AG-410-N11]|nr:hypothetical protein DID75_02590 [Candidatus Marinamargulisbacteria bacterium SCGC AG-410-N11]
MTRPERPSSPRSTSPRSKRSSSRPNSEQTITSKSAAQSLDNKTQHDQTYSPDTEYAVKDSDFKDLKNNKNKHLEQPNFTESTFIKKLTTKDNTLQGKKLAIKLNGNWQRATGDKKARELAVRLQDLQAGLNLIKGDANTSINIFDILENNSLKELATQIKHQDSRKGGIGYLDKEGNKKNSKAWLNQWAKCLDSIDKQVEDALKDILADSAMRPPAPPAPPAPPISQHPPVQPPPPPAPTRVKPQPLSQSPVHQSSSSTLSSFQPPVPPTQLSALAAKVGAEPSQVSELTTLDAERRRIAADQIGDVMVGPERLAEKVKTVGMSQYPVSVIERDIKTQNPLVCNYESWVENDDNREIVMNVTIPKPKLERIPTDGEIHLIERKTIIQTEIQSGDSRDEQFNELEKIHNQLSQLRKDNPAGKGLQSKERPPISIGLHALLKEFTIGQTGATIKNLNIKCITSKNVVKYQSDGNRDLKTDFTSKHHTHRTNDSQQYGFTGEETDDDLQSLCLNDNSKPGQVTFFVTDESGNNKTTTITVTFIPETDIPSTSQSELQAQSMLPTDRHMDMKQGVESGPEQSFEKFETIDKLISYIQELNLPPRDVIPDLNQNNRLTNHLAQFSAVDRNVFEDFLTKRLSVPAKQLQQINIKVSRKRSKIITKNKKQLRAILKNKDVNLSDKLTKAFEFLKRFNSTSTTTDIQNLMRYQDIFPCDTDGFEDLDISSYEQEDQAILLNEQRRLFEIINTHKKLQDNKLKSYQRQDQQFLDEMISANSDEINDYIEDRKKDISQIYKMGSDTGFQRIFKTEQDCMGFFLSQASMQAILKLGLESRKRQIFQIFQDGNRNGFEIIGPELVTEDMMGVNDTLFKRKYPGFDIVERTNVKGGGDCGFISVYYTFHENRFLKGEITVEEFKHLIDNDETKKNIKVLKKEWIKKLSLTPNAKVVAIQSEIEHHLESLDWYIGGHLTNNDERINGDYLQRLFEGKDNIAEIIQRVLTSQNKQEQIVIEIDRLNDESLYEKQSNLNQRLEGSLKLNKDLLKAIFGEEVPAALNADHLTEKKDLCQALLNECKGNPSQIDLLYELGVRGKYIASAIGEEEIKEVWRTLCNIHYGNEAELERSEYELQVVKLLGNIDGYAKAFKSQAKSLSRALPSSRYFTDMIERLDDNTLNILIERSSIANEQDIQRVIAEVISTIDNEEVTKDTVIEKLANCNQINTESDDDRKALNRMIADNFYKQEKEKESLQDIVRFILKEQINSWWTNFRARYDILDQLPIRAGIPTIELHNNHFSPIKINQIH